MIVFVIPLLHTVGFRVHLWLFLGYFGQKMVNMSISNNKGFFDNFVFGQGETFWGFGSEHFWDCRFLWFLTKQHLNILVWCCINTLYSDQNPNWWTGSQQRVTKAKKKLFLRVYSTVIVLTLFYRRARKTVAGLRYFWIQLRKSIDGLRYFGARDWKTMSSLRLFFDCFSIVSRLFSIV